jgi:hypothetical protein
MTISSLLTLVHQRTGLLARGLAQPQLASTSADAAVLAQFAREGAIEIAQALGRIEAQARVIVESGTASYSIPLAVDAPLRVTISLDAGEGDGVKTYDLPVRDGAACRARAEAGATEVGACGFFGGRFWLDALPQVSGTAEIYYHAGSLIAESEPGTTDEGGAGEASGVARGDRSECDSQGRSCSLQRRPLRTHRARQPSPAAHGHDCLPPRHVTRPRRM